MKVHVGEEETVGTRLDVVGSETTTVPDHINSVVGKVEIVGAPVDVRVNFSEPGFAKDEVVLVEGIEDRVE